MTTKPPAGQVPPVSPAAPGLLASRGRTRSPLTQLPVSAIWPLTCDNEDGPGGVGSTSRGLTHLSDYGGRGLGVSLPSEEQWRPVPGFEDRYEVSDLGRVRSLPLVTRRNQRRPGRIKAQHLATTGYWQVGLYRDDRSYPRTVHRLVALAFHGEPQPGQQVRHLNGNPLDARACNLAWGTDQENKADIKRHGHNHNVNKTHCPLGHEYTPDNTMLQQRPSGVGRQCRTCHRTRWRSPARR